MENVAIIGAGFVGLTLSIVMAESGNNVFLIEEDLEIVSKLKIGKAHFFEPELDDKLSKMVQTKKLFILSWDQFLLLSNAESISFFIIAVGTPLQNDGYQQIADTSNIIHCINQLIPIINSTQVIIMRSTVPVGTTESVLNYLLNKEAKILGVAYCPERTVEGNALNELCLLPQIISGTNSIVIDKTKVLFETFNDNIIVVSNTRTAEMCKLVDNTFRDFSFSFVNALSIVLPNLGIETTELIGAVSKNYPRTNILRIGPVGGPCLSKDPYILMGSISSVNGDLSIFLQGRIVNQLLLERIVKFLGKNFTKSNICISGLAFKGMPLTNDLRDSPGVKIVEEFIKNYNPNEVLIHDYEISTFNILGRNYVSSSIYSEELEVLVICNNNYKYELDLIEGKFSKKLRIIDLCEAISRTVKKSSTYNISTWGDFS